MGGSSGETPRNTETHHAKTPLRTHALGHVHRIAAVREKLVDVLLLPGREGRVRPVDIVDHEHAHRDAEVGHRLADLLLVLGATATRQ